MTRAGAPRATVECMWKAYKRHQTAFYVAKSCNVSPHTAQKYIINGKFATRFSKLKEKASEIADDAQADVLANDLIKLGNIKTLLTETILDNLKEKKVTPSIADLDKIIRLTAFIRGEPDQRTEEVYDFSWVEEGNDNQEGSKEK